jgi:predicted metal-dependent phosphoesterase TrpH
VDAIEIFNARCMSPQANHMAKQFATDHNLPGTAGSDAHTAFELGRATMLLPEFQDASTLRAVLPQARIEARLSSPLVHFTSRYAVWYKRIRNAAVEREK